MNVIGLMKEFASGVFLTTSFANNGIQELPQTGEEIAKTGAVIGGILLVAFFIILFIRKKKEK